MIEKPITKERIRLERVVVLLRYYKELKDRGHYQEEPDYQIEQLATSWNLTRYSPILAGFKRSITHVTPPTAKL